MKSINLINKGITNTNWLIKFCAFRLNNPQFSFAQAVELFSLNSGISILKTFDEWNFMGRRIKYGSKAIKYHDENDLNKKYYVFDISQTHGTDYPPQKYPNRDTLVRDINNLNYVKKNEKEDFNTLLKVVHQFNLENGLDKASVEENYFLDRYVSIFVNTTFNNSIDIPNVLDMAEVEIETERKIELCEEAEQIAQEITKFIIEERKFLNEYESLFEAEQESEEAQEFSNIQQYISSETVKTKTGQVRNARVKTSKRTQEGQISLFGSTGELNELSIVSAGTSEQIKDELNGEIENGKQKSIVYGEIAQRTNDTGYDRRNSVEQSSLSNVNNYHLSNKDFLKEGGAKSRFKDNVLAIKLVKSLDEEKRKPTVVEQSILAKYIGWGGMPQAFDENNDNWQKEYKELKELLTDEEYSLAKSTTLTAHYTNNTIIEAMYEGLANMGFTQGAILDPATGTGNFIGLVPDTFDKSQITGVEIDELTGKIAKYLYPQSNVLITGFENTNFKNNQFDCVITNVPFGAYKVYDRDYDKYNFFIHDYFIAKSIDKIKPNGLCAVITSKGTMDKSSSFFRKYIADRAELLGAIRLPNNAFDNAGTKVTADILFFKKRGTMIDSNDNWIYVGQNDDGIPLNEYFIENPQMLLGTMEIGSSMYGSETETYLQPDNRSLKEALSEAIQFLPKNVYKQSNLAEITNENFDILPADYNVRNFCYININDKIYMRVDDQMLLQDVSKNNLDRFIKMIEIRNQIRLLLDIQINNCTDEELKQEQNKLNNIYDSFVKKYGFLNSKFNRNLFRNDADFAMLVALENYDESTKQATKTDIFNKRTIRKHERVTTASNSLEALQISKNELGKVDIAYIEQLTGFAYDKVVEDLRNTIYKNPLAEDFCEQDQDVKYIGWETADEYLSGDVRQKLRIAEIAVKNNPIYEKNVEALKLAQPELVPASDISVKMGATWISGEYYKQFIIEKLGVSEYAREMVEVVYNKFDGSWDVVAPAYCKHSVDATDVYGTKRMNAFAIIEHSLNLQTVDIYDTYEEDGKTKRVLNKAETILAREKQNRLEQEFKDWIFEDLERRNDLVNKYNELFNNIKLQNYNGDYLKFPEMNPCIELKKHQKDAVERIITSGNTLLHHVVGAGKTFEIIAAAMKLRQFGLAHKPMIVVPNHLVMQWTREFKRLYPNANVLMATKKDLEKTNRLKFVSRVATGDWDSVIIAASSFEKIPLSKERQEKKIREELEGIELAILKAKEEKNRITIKNLERTKKNKEATLKKLTDGTIKDNLIKFEDLGVDYLFVDEAHKYKNKFIFTKMNNVAGISKAMSNRATDLDLKCEYINELHGGDKGIVFATGTPISNSMVEMFTMQSYMQRTKLKELGLHYFDAWAAAFGEKQTALELAPSGKGYRTRTRFAKFTNMPELLKLYRSFADVKTADMLQLPTPKANKITINTKPSDEILRLNEIIQERAELINDKKVSPEVDNMLKITNDGKKLALDPRCFDENAVDDIDHKVNVCIDKVYGIWEKTMDKRSTQILFCDLSTPKISFENYNKEQDFDVYNDIKSKLVEKGVPEYEIRFVHEANTDLQKQNLFDEVRGGKVRILIGSTEKCGAGTNVQDKLIALHHLDTPYRPSDLEQREGRIIRQGNTNDEVFIYTYVTERTFDSYSYQILENKQKFISQINKGDLTIREASDIDETTLSYAEIKAITTANPKIKQKMEVEQELSRLRTLEAQYKSNKYNLQDKINKTLPQSIAFMQNLVENLFMDIEMRNNNKSDNFVMELGNKTYAERKDAGEMLLNAVLSNKFNGKSIGSICGFDIVPVQLQLLDEARKVMLVGQGKYEVEISQSGVGSITRLENFMNSMEEKLEAAKTRTKDLLGQLESAKQEESRPFEYVSKIQELTKELAELNAELDLNKQEEIVIDDQALQNEKAPQTEFEELGADSDTENDDFEL